MAENRVPPGQHLTKNLPVLHYGSVPQIDLDTWRFKVFGLVDANWEISYAQFQQLPTTTITSDIHCVTTWSKLDTTWEGVPVASVLQQVPLKPEASFALVHAEGGWTTNLHLQDLLRPDVLLAYRYNGSIITAEHGWPLRLVVPHLYFWKSAKWVTGIELLDHEELGFWESHGYHRRGDPWKEERYEVKINAK